jgi:hypothetical protein
MTTLNPAEIAARLKALGLFGLLASFDEIADKPWLPDVLAIEERERKKRSLERRLRNSRVAAFKPMTDFDWSWPKKIDREAIEELFSLGFIKEAYPFRLRSRRPPPVSVPRPLSLAGEPGGGKVGPELTRWDTPILL